MSKIISFSSKAGSYIFSKRYIKTVSKTLVGDQIAIEFDDNKTTYFSFTDAATCTEVFNNIRKQMED